MDRPSWWRHLPVAAVVGALFVVVTLGQAPLRMGRDLAATWPILRLWSDARAQARLQFGGALEDALEAADAVLPSDAVVLLLTPGRDPRHDEYVAFHRALYRLAPRPVWWSNPAPSDGTWESRWWAPAPLTAEEIRSGAASRGASFLLFHGAEVPAGLGDATELGPETRLVSLAGPPLSRRAEVSVERPWAIGGLAGGLLGLFAAGAILVASASALHYRASRVEACGLAWILGAGGVSVAMFWLDAASVSLRAQRVVILALAIGLLLLAVRLRRALRRRPPVESVGSAWTKTLFLMRWFLGLFLLCEVAYVALLAVGRPLWIWDSWATWGMKARIIFRAGHVAKGVFADPSRVVTQLDYPLAVPLIEAWTFAWGGTADDRLAGIQAVLFFAAFLGLCHAALRRLGVPSTAALAFAATIGALPSVVSLAGFVFADMPLAAYATAAAAYALVWLETGSLGALGLAAVTGGLAAWTKREGLVLVAALCLAILIVGRRSRQAWVAVGTIGLGAAVLAGPWWILMATKGVRNPAFLPVTMATVQANLGRLPTIVRLELGGLLGPGGTYLWPATALIALAVIRSKRELPDLLLLAAVLYLGLMAFAYVFSDFVPYQQHVVASMYRLGVHVVSLPVLWLAWRGFGAPRARAPGQSSPGSDSQPR